MTPAQEQALAAYEEHGSYDKAAAAMGVSKGTVYNHVKRAREAKLIRGEAPDGYKVAQVTTRYDVHGEVRGQSVQVKQDGGAEKIAHVPNPAAVVKTSTYYNGDGRVTGQWVMEKPEDRDRLAAMGEAAKAFAADVIPAPAIILPPGAVAQDLCAVYPVGDLHVGMLAWAIETRGQSHDTRSSEPLLQGAARHLMQKAPRCGTGVIAFMGDYLHFDGFAPVTEASGHILDADTRFPRVARTGIRLARHTINAALNYHDQVHVIWEIGNHDRTSAIFFMELLANVYENNPRVSVDTHPGHYHYYEFGNNLLMTSHGHKARGDKLVMLMAADMPEAWGRTKHRTIFTGHVHHESRKDVMGCAVESVPVIIPNDAYAANAGYRSARAMQVVVFDREYGEDERHTFNPARLFRSAA